MLPANVYSKAIFAKLDHLMYCKLRAWTHRRHPHKNRQWQAHRYWLFDPDKRWTFAQKSGQTLTTLYRHAHTPFQRHIKAQAKRSPYDGDWIYWSQRTATFPTVVSVFIFSPFAREK